MIRPVPCPWAQIEVEKGGARRPRRSVLRGFVSAINRRRIAETIKTGFADGALQ
jgi:hypothetical protein